MVKIFQKKNEYSIKYNKKEYPVVPMKFEPAIQFFFIIMPYLRTIKSVKQETDPMIFMDVCRNYIEQLNPADLSKAIGLLLNIDEKEAREIPIDIIINNVPRFIMVNNMYNLYGLLKTIGAFE